MLHSATFPLPRNFFCPSSQICCRNVITASSLLCQQEGSERWDDSSIKTCYFCPKFSSSKKKKRKGKGEKKKQENGSKVIEKQDLFEKKTLNFSEVSWFIQMEIVDSYIFFCTIGSLWNQNNFEICSFSDEVTVGKRTVSFIIDCLHIPVSH